MNGIRKVSLKCTIIYILSALAILSIIIFHSYENNYNVFYFKTSQYKPSYHLSQGYFSEWVILETNIYFRRNLAFYYVDLNKIKLYLNRPKSKLKLNISLHVELEFKDTTKFYYDLRTIVYKTITQQASYSFESLESELIIPELKNLNENINFLRVFISNDINRTLEPINLIMKKFNEANQFKKHSIVCSKIYYVSKDLAGQFRWWIEMNKIHGYDKVVIYNNSIEDSYEFNKIFDDYKDFVNLIQFKCLPNFIDKNNTNKPFITSFNEIRNVYKINEFPYHLHYKHFVFTECYLQNKQKYKYITINDQDETVVPRYLNNFRRIEPDLIDQKISTEYLKQAEKKCYFDNKENNIQFYLNKLKNDLKLSQNMTFHFSTGIYMKDKTMKVLFNQLDQLFKLKPNKSLYDYSVNVFEQDEVNNRGGKVLNFNVTIKNEKEYLYAKYLLSVYSQIIEPFNWQNENELKRVNEPFNRFFYLLGPSTTWFLGKTIHNTFLAEHVNTHYPVPITGLKNIPIEYGHVSHFRKGYNIYWNDKSIMDFQFDLNYLLCYFKPIVKTFKFNITFKN